MGAACKAGLLLLWLAVACAFAPAARAHPRPVAVERQIANDLASKKAFVAVLIDSDDRRLLKSEAYADWHAYFTAFAEREKESFPVHVLSPRRAGVLSRRLPAKLRNATLFADGRGTFLVHDGLVLEPRVYAIGTAFLKHGAIDPQAPRYGLVTLRGK